MKTKLTVNHGSTKKNKRTMSGGKGIISTYTRRFKDRYKKFIGISDTDDTKKIKKLEAWGGLTGIYKFLEVDKKTFKNTTGDELSALEKMKENIENTPNSSNKDGYIRAIQCLEEGGDKILLNNGCVSYDVFVNGGDAVAGVDTDAAVTSDVVEGDSGTNNTDAVTSSNETQEGSPGDETGSKEEDEELTVEPEQPQRGPYDPTSGDNPDDAGDDAGDAEASEASGANAKADDTGDNTGDAGANVEASRDNAGDTEVADAPATVPGSTETGTGSGSGSGNENETESPQTDATSTGSDEQHGGGSKRRPKSSRRVKFSKSKKSRTTRRIVRKHRR